LGAGFLAHQCGAFRVVGVRHRWKKFVEESQAPGRHGQVVEDELQGCTRFRAVATRQFHLDGCGRLFPAIPNHESTPSGLQGIRLWLNPNERKRAPV